MKKITYLLIGFLAISLFQCTKDFGTINLTYHKATAIYGDLDEIRSRTPLISPVKEIKDPGKIFVGDNLLLIGEEGEGIHVIDNSEPSQPNHLLFLEIPGNKEFIMKDQVLYAESYYDFLKIDLTNPQQPRIISRLENAFVEEFTNAQGEVLIGFDFEEVTETFKVGSVVANTIQSGGDNIFFFDYANRLIPPSAVPASFAGNSQSGNGTVNRIALHKEHLYVVSRSTMTIIKDNDQLEFVNQQWLGSDLETIFPHGEFLFVGAQSSMTMYSVVDPTLPVMVSSFWHANSCDPVLPSGDAAYVTLRTGDEQRCPGDINALVVLDISQISNPIERQELEMQSPYGMALIGDLLFVGEGANGLHIFDATDPHQLVSIKHDHSVTAYDIMAHPSQNDIILITGPDGLGQYQINGETTLNLIHQIGL